MADCKKILIVDDSKVVRAVVRNELGRANDYREAATGEEALQIVKGGFVPDLITLDVEMPGLDGFETCERLYSPELDPFLRSGGRGRVPVVFLTARDTVAERRKGYEVGAIDFVSKKFEPGSLAALVKKILQPEKRLEGIQVLLVEDSRTIRQIVNSALSEVGVKVIEAESGLDAFTILGNRMSSIDLVLTDIEMPAMRGTDLCLRVRRELGLSDLPIVFFTDGNQALRIEAFRAGATDCIAKPFFKEELIARLQVHTEKAVLNKRLRHALAELRENLANQREMLATLSHDMRSPLSGIMGLAHILSLGEKRTAAETENIELIRHSGQMLLGMVDDILTLSKQQAGKQELELRPLEVGPLLERSVAIFQGLAVRKRQEIVFNRLATNTMVAGHAESLTRVFNNLLSNAHKFTPEGGRISANLESVGDHLTVVVKDTGVGIDPEKVAKIFDRYSSLSQVGTAGEASTGIGMSIVREFVQAHRGEIVVTSALGQGTEFRIRLPLIGPLANGATPPKQKLENESAHQLLRRQVTGRRILVADDNPINHIVAQAILEEAGCQVTVAVTGAEALARLLVTPLNYDLVFMDMRMPDMDGLAATRLIREAGLLKLPVVALTGSTEEVHRQRCLEAGMNDFLSKPIAPRAMLAAILQHCPPVGG